MKVAVALERTVSRSSAMAIAGVVTTKDVLWHTGIIVREFGAAAYVRCCVAILFGKRTTFLTCVFETTV